MSVIQKPFARWETFADCKQEQMQIGHSEESAGKICGAIQERAEKGTLFKGLPTLEILKGVDDDLIVGGIVSWELVDPQNDYVTTEAMVNFLSKLFTDVAPNYRYTTIDHGNFQIGEPLLQYPEDNPKYFTHVHEKGLYGIVKIRNDKLRRTQHYRKLISDGTYKMFSISGEPIRSEQLLMDNEIVRKIYDIDPFEWAIVKEGYNPKANIQILKGKCPPCIEHLKTKYMEKGFSEKTALDMATKLFNRVYERMEKEHMEKQDEKPPKDWWDACIASVTGADPAAVCGHIFHHVLGGDRSRAKPSMFKGKTADKLLEEWWMRKCEAHCDGLVKNPTEFCGAFWVDAKTAQWYHGPVKVDLLKALVKMTWEQCIAEARKDPDVTDPEKLCGWLRYYGPHGEKKEKSLGEKTGKEISEIYGEAVRKAVPELPWPHEKPEAKVERPSTEIRKSRDLPSKLTAKKIFRKHFPEYEGD